MRWSNLPPDFERNLQDWLSPTGWLKGPPVVVALGGNGSYFALSEGGSMIVSTSTPTPLWKQLVGWGSGKDMLSKIKV